MLTINDIAALAKAGYKVADVKELMEMSKVPEASSNDTETNEEPRRARTTSYLFPSAHRGVMMTSIMPAEISLTNSSIHLTDYVRSVPWSGMRLIGTP